MSRGPGAAQRFVLAYLDEHPRGATAEVIARAWKGEATRSAVQSVRRAADRLVEQGLVAREVASEEHRVPVGWKASRRTYRRRARYRRIGADAANT